MNTEVIITCAVTGGGDTVGKHPAIPVTPEQIANAAIEAAKAGAAVAHIHARDPKTGKNSRDPVFFREIVKRIRESNTDVVINLTGGNGGSWGPSPDSPMKTDPARDDVVGPLERMNYILELKPEICSLDCGAMNFGDRIYVNSPSFLRIMADKAKEAGIKPELEVFDMGQVQIANTLVAEGHVESPGLYQLCLGISYGAPATPEAMITMRNMLPKGSHWASFGISRLQMPMAATAVVLGGNVRVGLEDNLYLDRGVFASNGQLVERAVEIVTRLGARVLNPTEARKKLGLKNGPESRR
jgi:uncharacterized protein (DUF849 family)